ncbi:MAG: ABC transporter ATP-binding protein [Verrucomicrobia bacterium]|nr:ABC transporter ATP-binding protein [Verrucomicrobiota bacterium]
MNSAKPKPTPPGEVILEVKDLVQIYGKRPVLNGISFQVRKGETFVIMGGSGCGKTTLLRNLIGAQRPTSGSIHLFGEDITKISPQDLDRIRLRFGMNFQFGALFQSMTVGENIALPLQEHSQVDPSLIEMVVKMKLELVGLTGFENFKPTELSGGMRKRVGLARALALDPELVFSDEPTSGLDPVMTAVVDQLTLDSTRKIGVTAVVVSHDMTSCFRIATRLLMLGSGPRQGEVVAEGTPEEMKINPDPFLQQFLRGEADGPIPFRLSQDDYLKHLLGDG